MFYFTNFVTDGAFNTSGAAQIITGWGASSESPNFLASPLGTHVITYVQTGTNDKLYVDGNLSSSILVGQPGTKLNAQSAGVYLLGGGNSTCPGGARNTNAFTGTIYYAAFYNRQLTDAEVMQNHAAIMQMMVNRGLVGQNGLPSSYSGPRDELLIVGDSEAGSIFAAAGNFSGPAGNITLPSGMA